MYYLYVKTHNVTGLKYLGQTKRNPITYKGSGKRWNNHLNVHGNNVTTEIFYSVTLSSDGTIGIASNSGSDKGIYFQSK